MHLFDYELHPKAEDSGTYIHHSYVGFQAVSAAGPLIVEDAEKPPYSYDDERTIFLSDMFDRSDSNITQGLRANPFAWSGEARIVTFWSMATVSVRGETRQAYRVHFLYLTSSRMLDIVSVSSEEQPCRWCRWPSKAIRNSQ